MKLKDSFFVKLVGFVLLFFLVDFGLGFILIKGLNKYYGLGDDSEIALVGHSHLMLGLDKEKMEKELHKKVSKYTREGVNVFDRRIMVEQLLSDNHQLTTVIYGVDAWTFSRDGLSSNSYQLFYPFMDTKTIDDYVYSSADLGDYLTKKIIPTTRYDELLISGAVRGYLGNWTNLKFGTVDVKALEISLAKGDFRKIDNDLENIKIFKETLALLTENNLKVVLLYVPTIDLLGNAQEKTFQDTINLFQKITADYDNVEFLNLQDPWSHNYRMFYDAIHMNPEGQSEVTERVIHYLKNGG